MYRHTSTRRGDSSSSAAVRQVQVTIGRQTESNGVRSSQLSWRQTSSMVLPPHPTRPGKTVSPTSYAEWHITIGDLEAGAQEVTMGPWANTNQAAGEPACRGIFQSDPELIWTAILSFGPVGSNGPLRGCGHHAPRSTCSLATPIGLGRRRLSSPCPSSSGLATNSLPTPILSCARSWLGGLR